MRFVSHQLCVLLVPYRDPHLYSIILLNIMLAEQKPNPQYQLHEQGSHAHFEGLQITVRSEQMSLSAKFQAFFSQHIATIPTYHTMDCLCTDSPGLGTRSAGNQSPVQNVALTQFQAADCSVMHPAPKSGKTSQFEPGLLHFPTNFCTGYLKARCCLWYQWSTKGSWHFVSCTSEKLLNSFITVTPKVFFLSRAGHSVHSISSHRNDPIPLLIPITSLLQSYTVVEVGRQLWRPSGDISKEEDST